MYFFSRVYGGPYPPPPSKHGNRAEKPLHPRYSVNLHLPTRYTFSDWRGFSDVLLLLTVTLELVSSSSTVKEYTNLSLI